MSNDVIVLKSGPPGPAGPAGATGATGPDSSALQDVTRAPQTVFVDAVNGDDAGAGTSYATRVKTWERVTEVITANGATEIFVHADMNIDYQRAFYNAPKCLRIQGRNAANTADEARTFTILDSTNSGSRPGGLYVSATMGLEINDIDFVLNTSLSYGFIEARFATINVAMDSSSVTRTGSGSASVFYANSSGSYMAQITNITLTAAGYLFFGIGSGSDPNGAYNIAANITSA